MSVNRQQILADMEWREKYLQIMKDAKSIDRDSSEYASIHDCFTALVKDHFPLSIYKYYPMEVYAIESLKNNTLWFSRVNRFNDPFDSLAAIDLHSLMATFLAQKMMNEKSVELKTLKSTYDPIYKGLSEIKDDDFLQVEKEFLSPVINPLLECRNHYLCCCFTQEKDNDLMWAHYADNNKGFCVKYNSISLSNRIGIPFPVVYSEDRHIIGEADIFEETTTEILTMDLLYRKSLAWSYEKEWRIVFHDTELDVVVEKGVSKPLIDYPEAVYFGCDAIIPNDLMEFLKSKNIATYQMEKSDLEYKLIEKEI